jgi:exoribonuclease R
MENQIVCPHCKKTISNNSVIDDAAKGTGSDTQSILCDCGEKITYWQITAQLRDQKKLGWKLQNWIRTLAHSQG